jgi:hypothetical protein
MRGQGEVLAMCDCPEIRITNIDIQAETVSSNK